MANVEEVAKRMEDYNGINRERWVMLLEQLSELDEVVPQLIKDADRQYWIVSSLQSFLALSLENKQNVSLGKRVKNDFLETKILIKVNRLLPKSYLDLHKFRYVILGGLYVEVPVIIVNKEMSRELRELKDDRTFHERGLPDLYHYGTRKYTDDGFLVALGYSEVCPKYIYTESDWSYFELW